MTNSDRSNSLEWAHPLVKEWFLLQLGKPTEPQQQGWPAILKHQSTLISAPTGSGKTLAAFLICLNRIIEKALKGSLADETEVIYISPLKALGNDVQKNLIQPLKEIRALAKEKHLELPEIRVGLRTGDTLSKERLAMLKKPPHILITTPESFYILLTAQKSRERLTTVNTVIVDEIHALAKDKRGAHLTLSLERLEALCTHSPVRIGLSATQKPLSLIGQYLVGSNRALPNIIDIGHHRHMTLGVVVPKSPLNAVASNEMWDEIYLKLAECAKQNRSTLIFTNTRKLAERIAHHLEAHLGEGSVAAHHGSLSRKIRLEAESKLKNGELKALVATASLELGIDIGNIDLVCQIGSPRSIAAALQRIGRSGHWHAAVSHGLFFATTRDELLECAALIYAIKEGVLDKLIFPLQPLDILSQQIIAACATQTWEMDELFRLVTNAFPYQDLKRETFDAIIAMLSNGIASSRGRYSAYLFYDQVNQQVKARRHARLVAITSGGAIPDTGLFTVIAEPELTLVGTLDEDFAIESNRGDIILLGTTSWRVNHVEGGRGRVLVENAHGMSPSVPFWRGEAPARSDELSLYVAKFREKLNIFISEKQSDNGAQWLKQIAGMNDYGAKQLMDYLIEGIKVLGAIPTQQTIVAERFFDEGGGMQLVIHSPFGSRINKAWGLALRKRFCRSFNFELQAAALDNGLIISLAEQHSFPLGDVFKFLHPNSIKEVLVQAVLQSPLFKTRWKWVATRSLALVRFRNGKKMPPQILRMLADDLLAAVFPDAAACQDNLAGEDIKLPAHPLIDETMKEALQDALDLNGLIHLLKQIHNEKIECLAVDTPLPSVFSHEILNANPYGFLDDAPLEERRARAVQMRRMLPDSVLNEVGKLDQAVIALVQKQVWPDVRNEDELHDQLQSLIGLPYSLLGAWATFFTQLQAQKRATTATVNNERFCVIAEKVKTFQAIFPECVFADDLKAIEATLPSQEEALVEMLRHWMQILGPTTERELHEMTTLEVGCIHQALLKLEATGIILRGHFRTEITDPLEWCERRLLARIHRLTVDNLRKEIEPVNPAQFMNWLLSWQHMAKGTQLSGEEGLLSIIKQLQGFELPANAWEAQIFKPRLVDYDRFWLDKLCLTGQVAWGRLSPHPVVENQEKKVVPRSIAPITFYCREGSDWLTFPSLEDHELILKNLSHVATLLYQYLKQNGATFFADLIRGVRRLQSEVEMGLWELVAAGLVTADGFDNLRALIDPKRRADRVARRRQLQYSTGRWALIHQSREFEQAPRLEAICWLLLKRYGVVFRDLIVREKNIPRWRELLLTFRQLEDRGEIRGGRFINGFSGEQFALPYAIDSLRAMKSEPLSKEVVSISCADPLNLAGILLPGSKISTFTNKNLQVKEGIILD